MSTFSGIISEYDYIAIDSFEPKVKYYFISHYHLDHVKGIDCAVFEDEHVYCSEETKLLILADKAVTKIHKNLRSLPINEKNELVIESPNGSLSYQINVTLIQASHCIGSVMFLFEGDNGRVLYTGDFRFKVGDTARIKELHEAEKCKPIDCLYLDTTFFNPVANIMPSREQSTKAILKIVEKWLNRGEDHVVRIETATRFSFDYLIAQLRLKFRMKIHVTHEQRDQYRFFPQIQSNLTVYPNETRIHNCWSKSSRTDSLPCSYVITTARVLTIKPTTLYFQDRYSFNQLVTHVGPHLVRACYNHHSSYSELVDMIRYLSPKRIVPCVVTYGDDDIGSVQERLDQLLNSMNEDATSISKPFGILKSPHRFKSPSFIRQLNEDNSQNELHFPSSSNSFLQKLIRLSPNPKLSPSKIARYSATVDPTVTNQFESSIDEEGDHRHDCLAASSFSQNSSGDRSTSSQLNESIDQSTTTNEITESSISLFSSQEETTQISTQISVSSENRSSQENDAHSPSMLTVDRHDLDGSFLNTLSSSPVNTELTSKRVSNLFDDLVSLSSSDDIEEVIDLTEFSDD